MKTLKQLHPWILSVFSGTLLVLIFPGFDLENLAWFSLVPLFFAIQNEPLPRASLFGFVAGMVFYSFGLSWVTNTMINYGNIPSVLSFLILLILASYLSLYVALFCYLAKRWSQGNPVYFLLLTPVIWTSLEYLRSTHLEYGFSWLGLGYSQYKTLPVIQMAEITGVYGISTLIVFVNATLHYLLNSLVLKKDKLRGPALRSLGLALAIFGLWTGFGNLALNRWEKHNNPEQSLQVGLIQGNIPQNRKWNPLFKKQVMRTYRDLSNKAAKNDLDLIVWPEAATPFFYSLDPAGTEFVQKVAQETKAPLLFGSPYQEIREGKKIFFNSAYLISPEGETLDRYEKIHLVPFGEFVPFQTILFFVRKMVEGVGDFGRGETATVFDLNGGKFGVSICYEITFPDLVRQPVRRGAEFLVNITNDAWFGRSAASYQHIAMGALRAVENRVPIVRAANTGITGTIDPTGKIRQTTELFVEDWVQTTIHPNRNPGTYYSRYGDVFSHACMILTGIFAFLAYRANRRT